MSTLSVEQRGDLAETMLPVAAHLAVLVHGDGGPEDVAQVLGGMDDTAKNALIVVLAGLVDPEQPVGKALGWLDFNEHGSVVVPSWSEKTSVRGLAPEVQVDTDDDYVDPNAVDRFIKGFRIEVTDADFLAAVQQCVAEGMALSDVDRLRKWPAKTAEKWVNRIRKRYQRAGRVFPSLAAPTARVFTEQEVIAMRERAAEGATDLEIAMSFDTFANTVGAIVRGARYRQFGGPLRKARNAAGALASRQFMCGHADNSWEGTRHHPLGTAA